MDESKEELNENVNKKDVFVLEFVKNPIGVLKDIANSDSKEYLRTSIIILIIITSLWFLLAIRSEYYYLGFSRVFTSILTIIKNTISPALSILVYSMIALVLNRNNKKKLTTIISTITISRLPLIFTGVVSLLNYLNINNLTYVVSAISTFCLTILIVLNFFALKQLFNKDCKNFIKTYILIQVIYYTLYLIVELVFSINF